MKLFFVLSFVWITHGSLAQGEIESQKIGHADWHYIFSQMREYKQIESELKTFEAQLQNQLKLKASELEAKVKAYQELPPNTPEAIRKDRESELRYLQENFQNFQQEAQVALQKKQNDLVGPVFEKVGKAIEAVALEHGFSYIINPQTVGGDDVLLFASKKYNISDMVLMKLGVDITNRPREEKDNAEQ